MTLREHIIELRNRLVISVAAIVIGTIAAWFIYKQAFNFLTSPFFESVRQLNPQAGDKSPELTLGGVGDALTFQIKVSALIGLILAGPIWLYQLWAFIAPGLHRSEKKWTFLFAGIAAPLFVGGMAVAYWTLPKGIAILISFTPDSVQNLVDVQHYLDFVIQIGRAHV